ncbi:MAG: hypothetical protein U9N12_00220 [Euryarchaeota archaeon]|nr:hypothetical protein [Euryarchaeota archaeon]
METRIGCADTAAGEPEDRGVGSGAIAMNRIVGISDCHNQNNR